MKTNRSPSRLLLATLLIGSLLCSFALPIARAQTKWHPGHYLRLNTEKRDPSRWNSDSAIASINNEPTIQGVEVTFYWAALEGPTPGDYTFDRIDHYLSLLAPAHKRLIVEVWDESFGAKWTSFQSDILPAYLNSTTYDDGWTPMKSGGCAKAWNPRVMDRLIALFQALAAKYDTNPYFETIKSGETARGINPNPPDYSEGAWLEQWQRWAVATRAAWPHTNVQVGINFGPYGMHNGTYFYPFIETCYANRIMGGGPDILLPDHDQNPTPGQIYINTNHPGQMGLQYDQQYTWDFDTPDAIYQQGVVRADTSGNHSNYVAWLRHTDNSDGHTPEAMFWATGVLPYLRDPAHAHTVTTMPTSYQIESWLGFEEGSGTAVADSSGAGNGATLHGATWATGRVGGAIHLSAASSQYVEMDRGPSSLTQGMTVAFWAYPESIQDHARFIDLSNGPSSDNIILFRDGATNDLAFQIYNGDTPGNRLVATNQLALNTWQHFAATVDASGNAVLYKDGMQVASGHVNPPATLPRGQNYIGRSAWPTDAFYDGKIDELHVYGRVLSATEIAALEASGTTPRLRARGNGSDITNGDSTPGAADDTDFGSAPVVGGTLTRIYTIQNLGSGSLTLGPVIASGVNAADFEVISQPASILAALESTTFSVRFDPAEVGLRTATLSLTTNDPSASSFGFAIQGTGIEGQAEPEIDVQGHGVSIANGDDSPATADGTGFGTTLVNVGTLSRTYTILNQGNAPLSVGPVTISGANAGEFTLTAQPAASVLVGDSTTFTVQFAPGAIGERQAVVHVANNDPDEGAYQFAIEGGGTTSTSYELENHVYAASDAYRIRTSPDDVLLQANATGDYIVIAVPGVPAGIYDIDVVVQTGPNRAIFQLESSTSPSGPFVPLGDTVDTYATGFASLAFPVATGVTFDTSGTRYFRFRIMGRNAHATARYLAVDELRLKHPVAAIALSNLDYIYDGTPKMAAFTTTPAGLAVAASYNGGVDAPVNAGTYAVVASIVDPSYIGSATGTLTIHAAPATVALDDLSLFYDGTPREVGATTVPAELGYHLTYDGSDTVPTLPGSYTVVATVTNPNYFGTITGTLVVATTASVRHAPSLNAGLDGSIQVLSGESFTLSGNAMVSGDLLVPGTPTLRQNGHPTFAGISDSTGQAEPSNYKVTLDGNPVLRHLVRRVDPLILPSVSAPPLPAGTRSVVLDSPGQSAGDFATLRDLTLNGNTGQAAVPAGTYGNFVANDSSGFTLGSTGSNSPVVYNLQTLILNGDSRIEILGPVIINLANGLSISGNVGQSGHPEWLALHVANGGVTLDGSASVAGEIVAPNGTVTINGNSTLTGRVSSDRLTINGNGLLQEP